MKFFFTFCLAVSCIALTAHAQNDSYNLVDTIAGRFVKNLRTTDKEKIILLTDRKIYAAGEKIWFKAFLMRSLNNRIDTTSKNLFVDLVDDSDRVIKQLVLNTVRFHTDGAIALDGALPTGYYWLRCYTQNVLQTDSLAICVQPLYIKNLDNSNILDFNYRPVPKRSGGPVIQFFPEGGALIAGINSTGALRVQDADGNPLPVSGVISDGADSVVAHFSTNNFGLARISFYPVWFKKYFAVLTVNGQNIKYPIPSWNPFAAQLSVTRQTKSFIQAYVTLEDSIYNRKFPTYVLGISRDSICFAGVGRGMYEIDIPASSFPGGAATLLLFDANEHLLSERSIFIDKDNYRMNILPDKKNYTARDNAIINLEVTDDEGHPLVAALNVSVQDSRIMQVSDEIKSDTILPTQPAMLDDWLKRNKGSLSAADIDLFMLAQKPAFSNWQVNTGVKQIVADNTNLLLNVEGTVVNRKQQPLGAKVVTAISVTGTNPYIAIDTTNEAGGFQLPLPFNSNNLLLKVQVKSKHDISENDSITVHNFVFPHFSTPSSLKHFFAAGKQVFQQKIARYHVDTVFVGTGKEWLKPVTVRANIKPKAETDYDQSKRLSSFSYIISGSKLGNNGYGEISNAMLMVPGLSFVNGQLSFYGSANTGEPIIIMDGIQIQTVTLEQNMGGGSPVMAFLATLDARSIDFIEVLNGPSASIYGNQGGNGVIVINTKSRPSEVSKDNTPYKIIQPVTYHTAPAFAMPDYANKQVKNGKSPDPRTTIYWNGNLVTKTDGKASVNFFTADDVTNYIVIVSGVTANGEYINKRITLSRK